MTLTFSDVHKSLGNFGPFQVLVLLQGMLLCTYDSEMVTMVFVGGHMEHWCRVDELVDLSTDLQRALVAPLLDGSGGRIARGSNSSLDGSTAVFSPCMRYERNYSEVREILGNSTDEAVVSALNENANDLDIVPCERFAYSHAQYKSTIVSQFDLVCGLEFLVPLTSSLYMLGGLIGCLTAGYVSDSIGRKRTLLISLLVRVASTWMFIFAPSIHVFIVGRFILGFAGNAVRVTHFILVIEMFAPSCKTYVTAVLVVGISIGAIFMSLLAKFVRDHFLYQVFTFSPIFLLFPYAIFLLPESPRWLHLNGRHEEVNKVWSRIACLNRRKLPDDVRSENLEPPKKLAECKTTELFTSKLLLLRIIVPGYAMLAGSLIYFAIMLNMSSLAGDVFVNSCISSAVEVPGYLLGLYFCNHKMTRRRTTMVASMCIVGGLQIVCIPIMITGHLTTNSALMLASRAFTCSAVLVMTIYSAELLPTQIRNTGFGFLMTCARMGSIIAPYAGKTLIEIWRPLPSTIFGVISVTSGLLCLLLPETSNEPVFDTIYELKLRYENKGNSTVRNSSHDESTPDRC